MDQVDHTTVWVRHEVTPDFWSLFLSRLPHCSPGAALISLHLPPSLPLSPAAWSFPRGKTWRLNSLQLSSIPSLSPSSQRWRPKWLFYGCYSRSLSTLLSLSLRVETWEGGGGELRLRRTDADGRVRGRDGGTGQEMEPGEAGIMRSQHCGAGGPTDGRERIRS